MLSGVISFRFAGEEKNAQASFRVTGRYWVKVTFLKAIVVNLNAINIKQR